jgi:hypothetical protein
MKTDEKETPKSEPAPEDARRESGEPGGGKGRRDEVGKSGVYPASGPLPDGPAKVQELTSWGQGSKGAEGYEDHGDSEMHVPVPGEDKSPAEKKGE